MSAVGDLGHKPTTFDWRTIKRPDPLPELTYTIYVSKKVSDGNYGGDEVGIHVQTTVAAGTDPLSPHASDAIGSAIHAGKVHVADALGMRYEDGRYRDRSHPKKDVKRWLLTLLGDGRADQAADLWHDAQADGVIDANDLTARQFSDLQQWVKDRVEPFDTGNGDEDEGPAVSPPSAAGPSDPTEESDDE